MRRRPRFDPGHVIHGFTFMMRVLVVLFLAMVATMVNPGKRDQSLSPSAGDMTIEAHWPDTINVDVDLWVRGPHDRRGVGYSHTSDRQFSLVRDDRGSLGDTTERNFEMCFARGLGAGTYVVNLHLYGLRQEPPPITVRVVAAVTTPTGRVELASRDVYLTRDGEETTAFSFELDSAGVLVPGSVSEVYIPLRAETPNSDTESQ